MNWGGERDLVHSNLPTLLCLTLIPFCLSWKYCICYKAELYTLLAGVICWSRRFHWCDGIAFSFTFELRMIIIHTIRSISVCVSTHMFSPCKLCRKAEQLTSSSGQMQPVQIVVWWLVPFHPLSSMATGPMHQPLPDHTADKPLRELPAH